MINNSAGSAYFLYRSFASTSFRDEDINDIVQVARSRNGQLGLTGHLHHEDGMFFQWLEGEEAALREVIASLSADPRHRDMLTLGRGRLPDRYFSGWNMQLTGVRNRSIVNWLADRNVSIRNRVVYAQEILYFMQNSPLEAGILEPS